MPTIAEAIATVNRVYREHNRYTGDGKPGAPINAPLPNGDPQSGQHSPKKSAIREAHTDALIASLEETARAAEAADLADAAAVEALAAQSAAEASQAAAQVSVNSAQAAAEASGNVVFYQTYALANAAVASLPANQVVEVFVDEQRNGERTRYRKEGGALVFKLRLSNSDVATKSGAETFSNKTFAGEVAFATGGQPVSMTSDGAPFVPDRAFVQMKNANSDQFSLRVTSQWAQTTGSPFVNNDGILSEIYSTVASASANQSWALSAANAYHNIPAGVTDSGMRVGVLGWAVSVNVAGYTHAGRLAEQYGVWGRAGFQGGGAFQSPSTARVTKAVAVRGEIATDSPSSRMDVAMAGLFESINSGQVDDNYAVYARAAGATTRNYAFWGEAGKFFNRGAMETDGSISMFSGVTTAQLFNNGTNTGYATNAARSAGQYMAINGSTWTSLSDARIKGDVVTVSVLDKLDGFRAVTYTNLLTGMDEFGVIAQEMAQCFPEFVIQGNDDPDHKPSGIDDPAMWQVTGYERMGAYALQGVRELHEIIRELKSEIALLKAKQD